MFRVEALHSLQKYVHLRYYVEEFMLEWGCSFLEAWEEVSHAGYKDFYEPIMLLISSPSYFKNKDKI